MKTLNQTNLPLQPSPLVGRERELADVLDLLQSSRLVTLTGPGGSGKTRLALQAAAERSDEFRDGVWFVSLAPLEETELISEAIASVIGSGDNVFVPVFEADAARGRQCRAASSPSFKRRGTAAGLPGLTVLATSRERLAVGAEHEYVVPTLVLERLSPSFPPALGNSNPRS